MSCFLVFALVCSPFFAVADEGARLETVVVRAEKVDSTWQTGDVDLDTTPGFYSLIERSAFEGKIESIGEVLKKEAGVQIRQSGGLGSYSSVSLRGASSDQVMVFMDGILLNDASMGGVDLSNISLADVEAIEVFRGVSPLQFGKASLGGVVNIRTLRSQGEKKRSITLGAGSFDTQNVSAFINNKPGRMDYLISADVLKAENDFWILNRYGTDNWPYDDKWERRINNDFSQGNLLTKVGMDVTPTVRLDFSNQYFQKDQSLPSWNNHIDTETTFDTKRNNTILKLTVDEVGPFNFSGYADYSWKEEEYDDRQVPNGGIGLGMQHNLYETERMGGHFVAELEGESHQTVMMADACYESYKPENLLFPDANPKESRRRTFSAGLQETLFFTGDKVSITPAVRWYHVRDNLQSAMSSSNIPLEGASETKDYFSPQVGARWRIIPTLTFKANIAEYTREPSFFELFGDRGLFLGNADLQSEKGVNWDVGFLYSQPFEWPWFSRFSLDCAWFQSDLERVITRKYDARGVGKSVNVNGADIRGIETEMRVDFLKIMHAVSNVTWQDATSTDSSDNGVYDGKRLSGRYRLSWYARLEARFLNFKLYGEWMQERGMFYDTTESLKAPPKEDVNLGVSWAPGRFLITVEGKNLTNDRYEDYNGYYMPGQGIYATVKYSF